MNNYIGILKQMKKRTLHRLDVSLLSCVCVWGAVSVKTQLFCLLSEKTWFNNCDYVF